MNRRTIASLTKQIEKQKSRIAAERDTLRALLDEASAIAECCDEVIDNLDRATDVLSEYL